jgi:hypothetical protein
LTTDLGAIDSLRIGFVQDASDGIAIRLDAALPAPIPAGTTIEVDGPMDWASRWTTDRVHFVSSSHRWPSGRRRSPPATE